MLNVQSTRTSVAARGNVQGTMLPRSYQAAHRTTTSAFMSNRGWMPSSVPCQSYSYWSHALDASRWTHRVGCSNKKCNVHVHGLSCKDTFTITSMLMSSSCTHDLFLDHKVFRLCIFPETMVCKDENPKSYSHSSKEPQVFLYINSHWWMFSVWSSRKSSTAASQCLCTQLMTIPCCNYMHSFYYIHVYRDIAHRVAETTQSM